MKITRCDKCKKEEVGMAALSFNQEVWDLCDDHYKEFHEFKQAQYDEADKKILEWLKG